MLSKLRYEIIKFNIKPMNIDQNEIKKFDDLSSHWWNKQGALRTLHQINPLRLQFIEQQTSLTDKAIVDVGCGGGILTEALALKGGNLTGIDLSSEAIKCAHQHAKESLLTINYQQISVADFALQHAEQFDIVVCMEMLEHVPNPAAIITACSQLLKPGGHAFFSTINRNPKAYFLAVVAAEYLMKLLPRGTHDYKKFITPNELTQACRAAELTPQLFQGIHYNPLSKEFSLNKDISVNYLLHCRKEK